MVRSMLVTALRELGFFDPGTPQPYEKPGYFVPLRLVKEGQKQRFVSRLTTNFNSNYSQTGNLHLQNRLLPYYSTRPTSTSHSRRASFRTPQHFRALELRRTKHIWGSPLHRARVPRQSDDLPYNMRASFGNIYANRRINVGRRHSTRDLCNALENMAAAWANAWRSCERS